MQEIFFDIHLFSNIYLIAISIIVQFIIYPSFKKYSFVEFKTFHSDYTKKMFLIVGPVMTLELLCCVFLLIENSTLFLTPTILLIIIWILTFFLIVPIHNKLNIKFNLNDHKNLIRLNGLRTLLWVLKVLFIF